MKKTFSRLILAVVFLALLPALVQGGREAPPRPSIGLALGSGGAAGLAHIAMLQVFDDLGVKPERIVGTSIGAVIGVLYAAGLSAAEIREIFAEFGGSSLDVLSRLMRPTADLTLASLLKIDIDNGGVFDSGGFLEFLAGKIEARSFADLVIPLEVVATDYWTGEMVVLDRGDLFTAIGASMAVPGLFAPVSRGEELLIDGGTSNPLPFDLLEGRSDLVVAIDVSGPRASRRDSEVGFMDLMFRTFQIMQQSITAARIAAAEPAIYIKADIGNVRLLHFNRIEAILEQAEPAAAKLRGRLVEIVGKP